MNFVIPDMLKALHHLTGAMSGSTFSGTLDYSYITPTIIALGEFSEGKVDELLQLTRGDPVVMWNLGGKPLSHTIRLAFNNQIIDVPWKTPCQYTKAPLLETVFSLCQSIKSWYDLHVKHLAIIHCPAGHPSTGIVVACLLKYIGAFEHAAHAYDFYCSKRLKGDPGHSLAPSYRNLFTNVDKTVDQDGYAITDAKYLKTITIAGLPVEEIPCVEVADINGTLYSSHVGWHANSSCTWNPEYGDGFYKVSTNIIGDFSIICRFGGSLSNNKDRSTLIFKYQNSTAFLAEEVLELKFGDVDINPQYADSLDLELFTIHLMFENNPVLITRNHSVPQTSGRIKLDVFPRMGMEAFDAGLQELSKLHSVLPEAEKQSNLMDTKCEEKYIPVSLQLANNDLSIATRLLELIHARTAEISGEIVPSLDQPEPSASPSTVIESVSDDSNWEVVDLKCRICKDNDPSKQDQVISCSQCQKNYHTFCVGLRRIPFGCKTEKDQMIREKYIKRHLGEWKCSHCNSPKPAESGADGSSSSPTLGGETRTPQSPSRRSKQDQIAILIAALASAGIGIDELIRMSEEQQRECILNVMAKKYPDLKLDNNNDSKGTLDLATAMQGILSHANNSMENNNDIHKLLPAKSTHIVHHPSASLIKPAVDINSSSSVEVLSNNHKEPESDARANMLEVIKRRSAVGKFDDKQPPSNIAGPYGAGFTGSDGPESPNRFGSSRMPSHLMNNNMAMNGKGFNSGKFPVLGNISDTAAIGNMMPYPEGFTGFPASNQFGSNQYVGNQFGGGSNQLGSNQFGSNQYGGNQLGNNQYVGSQFGSNQFAENQFAGNLQGSTGNNNTGGTGSGNEHASIAPKMKEITEYNKYFKMIKAGIPKNVIADKIVADGTLSSHEMANSLLNLNPEEAVPEDFVSKLNVLVTLATHPKYEKFYKMLKVGISKDIVKAKMQQEGVNGSVLDRDPNEKVPLNDVVPHQLLPNHLTLTGAEESGNVVFVPISEHAKYAKFFQMMQMGIPLDIVKSKMAEENIDPKVIEKDPKELAPVASQEGNEMVPVGEHPKYMKYFKMLKVGLPKEAVQAKMQQENVDPSMLDKPADEKIPLNAVVVPEKKKEEEGKKVAIREHPKYEKYFKMLKVGLPVPVVKNKMVAEGVDPSFIDKDPNEMIPLEDAKVDEKENDKEVKKVPISEHPKYEKYFKMLKVGLPIPVVKNKMQLEGVDPSFIEKDPNEMIPLEDEKKKEEIKKVPICEHPKYEKFFKMLKVGLPIPVVKNKMVAEGVDPSFIEKDPSEMIPLDDEKKKENEKQVKKVPISEHPKYEKYFKMLKVGLPIPVVKNKMQSEGVDPSFIEKDPSEMIPLEDEKADEGKKVPAAEHPLYEKYFKMLKVGIPPHVVKGKMGLEKLDPTILDKDPTELIPLNDTSSAKSNGPKVAPKPVQRKKKLHWKAINQVNANSIWADENNDVDFDLDEEEFNKLFVETVENKSEKKVVVQEKKDVKKTKVVLIDMKRAQNGSIALARIKFSPEESRSKIANMNDDGITTDQLKSMAEYLPTPDETAALRAYSGEKDAIGIAERYMLEMTKLSTAAKCIQCMIYKQLFRGRYQECKSKIAAIQNACDDVKMSSRLKKVLKTILKIGNQLNDGEVNKGFSVESLLKLQSAKAFDKKTTVLQYVVTLILRNDEDSLKFPEDLKHVSEASRYSFDTITTEKNALRQEFDTNLKIVEDIREKNPESDTDRMLDFLTKADSHCSDLERGFEKSKEKFAGVLMYFGEDTNMSPNDFFSTLSKFIQEFIGVRETVERVRKAELKRLQQSQQQQQQTDNKSLLAKTSSRRHNSMITTSDSKESSSLKLEELNPKAIAEEISKKENDDEVPPPKSSMPDRSSLLQDIMKKPANRRKSAMM